MSPASRRVYSNRGGGRSGGRRGGEVRGGRGEERKVSGAASEREAAA